MKKANNKYQGVVMTSAYAGVDTSGGKWIASCDRHGTFVYADTKKDAVTSAANTQNFCDACRDEEN